MPIKQKLPIAVFSLVAMTLIGCGRQDEQPVTYERAITISRATAERHGYDLRRYALDTFGDPAADKEKWLIAYGCLPAPPPPGCSFLVAVDRKTGSAELFPGE